jgi:hypothetical protein
MPAERLAWRAMRGKAVSVLADEAAERTADLIRAEAARIMALGECSPRRLATVNLPMTRTGSK